MEVVRKIIDSDTIDRIYPEYREQIAAELSAEICDTLIAGTEDLLCWIKAQL